MSRALKKGQRVRVSERNRRKGRHPGEKGTVLRGPIGTADHKVYYLVTLGRTAPERILAADEVEPDV